MREKQLMEWYIPIKHSKMTLRVELKNFEKDQNNPKMHRGTS